MKTFLCVGDACPHEVSVPVGLSPKPGDRLQTNGGNGPVIDIIDVHTHVTRQGELQVQLQAEIAP